MLIPTQAPVATAPLFSSSLPPLSLYIHIPWCVRKCPYCDFNSHVQPEIIPESEYIQALLADLDQDLSWVQGRSIATIFFGGGTPSLLSASAYQTLFDGLRQRVTFADDIEITLEANPGTFEAEKFAAYRALGVNRLSIGVQTFDSDLLKTLGRIHDGDQAQNAISVAKQAGFENFNIDLMHGLPGQTVAQALSDLNTALAFAPPHLSWYQLTLEPNTEFYKYPPILPDDDTLWDIQEAGNTLLASAGFEHYEISAFAQPRRVARHNINYWTFGDYLGLGAGAHGKVTLHGPTGMQIFRSRKTRLPKDYLNSFLNGDFINGQKHQIKITEAVDRVDVGLECLMNALRLTDGISVADFQKHTGLTLEDLTKPIAQAQKLGLLEVDTRIYPSERGQRYLNELLGIFLTD
ncbi:MAG: radical SAM family heme chaperone HemW [Oleibacter sp.]|nr:radical SAM family heme chaperone HemW [Thalassolituus sp.]